MSLIKLLVTEPQVKVNTHECNINITHKPTRARLSTKNDLHMLELRVRARRSSD